MPEEEKEHPATARQRERFVERGELPEVKDLSGAVVLAVVGVVVAAQLPSWAEGMAHVMHRCLERGGRVEAQLWQLGSTTYWQTLRPVLVAALSVALGAGLLRQGGALRFRPPKVDFARLDPLARLGNLFSGGAGPLQLGAQVVKMLAVGVVAATLLAERLPHVLGHVPISLGQAVGQVGQLMGQLFVRGTLVLVLLGAWGYYRSRVRLERRMSMSAQEVRDEVKEQVGDPAVRGRIKGRAKEILQKRMLLKVPKATVVVTNPTHVAVALMYDERRMRVPVVVAKGAGEWADRIRAVARRHQVPVVQDPPLARQLYGEVELAEPVPERLYHAVAVLLAHVYAVGNPRS